jgi:putative aldouronate transport system permease protein
MFLSAGMMPTYVMVKNLGLLNSIWAMIIPGLVSLWNYLVIRSFFIGLPRELEEAALIDGASWFTTFTRIILPISKPVIATFTLYYAVGHWNTWYNSMLYCSRDSSLTTLQLFLRRMVVEGNMGWQGGQAGNAVVGHGRVYTDSVKMATCVVAMVPILIVYPLLQKHFVKGATLGSIKG